MARKQKRGVPTTIDRRKKERGKGKRGKEITLKKKRGKSYVRPNVQYRRALVDIGKSNQGMGEEREVEELKKNQS